MRLLIALIFLLSSMASMQAQQNSNSFWLADFTKTKAGHRAELLYYLEQNWKLYRDSALARGYISGYRLLETTPDSLGDFDFILLMEFPDSTAFHHVEANFQPLMKKLRPSGPVLLNSIKAADFREIKISKDARTVFAAQAKSFPQINIPQTPENLEHLREINRDIWTPFSEAYASNDAEKYISLHAADFIRASGGKWAGTKNLAEYGASVKNNFNRNTQDGRTASIDFTFFERVAGAETASERGIYRSSSMEKDGTKRDFYGKFHVFHRKVNGAWKIAVDYDSNEDGTVGEADFRAGRPVDKL
ncbi:MAG: nuclear transport factor 2 family protein [Saprospiraceae bacterium]|nr:nuclear transport factor 2 family protein [Saprospiraceae bacterium]